MYIVSPNRRRLLALCIEFRDGLSAAESEVVPDITANLRVISAWLMMVTERGVYHMTDTRARIEGCCILCHIYNSLLPEVCGRGGVLYHTSVTVFSAGRNIPAIRCMDSCCALEVLCCHGCEFGAVLASTTSSPICPFGKPLVVVLVTSSSKAWSQIGCDVLPPNIVMMI